MALTLDSWLYETRVHTSAYKMFYDLVETFGMKIPIMAAQKPFEKEEQVFLALPTFLLPRYDSHFHNPMGQVTVHDRDELHGFYLVSDNKEERVYFWLPCFFFHRDKTLAKQMFEKQLSHMLKTDREEASKGISFYERKYQIPEKFKNASTRQLNDMFYESYEKPSIVDLKQKTKSLGF